MKGLELEKFVYDARVREPCKITDGKAIYLEPT